MAKRFTDSLKWADPWFGQLTISEKMIWIYICDNCDHAGIWKVNIPLLRFHLGADADINPERFSGRVVVLGPEKWFIPKFIEFQYGTLNQDNRAHASVLAILEREGVNKGLARGLKGRKDMDKDKDKDKDSVSVSKVRPKSIIPTLEEVKAYFAEVGTKIDPKEFFDHYESKGWMRGKNKIVSWKHCLTTWEKNQIGGLNGNAQRDSRRNIVEGAAPVPGKYADLERRRAEAEKSSAR